MAAKNKKDAEEKEPRVRVNMRLPADLTEWVREYAESRNKTFTQVVVDRLTDLKAEEAV